MATNEIELATDETGFANSDLPTWRLDGIELAHQLRRAHLRYGPEPVTWETYWGAAALQQLRELAGQRPVRLQRWTSRLGGGPKGFRYRCTGSYAVLFHADGRPVTDAEIARLRCVGVVARRLDAQPDCLMVFGRENPHLCLYPWQVVKR